MKRRQALVLILGGALFLYVVLSQDQTRGSTYSTRPRGTMAFMLLMKKMGFQVEQWRRPLGEFSAAEAGALFIVSPAREPAALGPLFEWIERGNRLVYFGSPPKALEEKLAIQSEEQSKSADFSFSDLLRTSHADSAMDIDCPDGMEECRGVLQVSELSGGVKAPSEKVLSLAGHADYGSILRASIGKGEIWYFSEESIISNEHIDKFDNLRLLYQIASATPRIFFDEFHHGHVTPLTGQAKVKQESIYLFAIVLTVVFAAAALSQARRLGPALLPQGERAPRAVESASALGLLYCEYEASEALRFYLQSWKTRVAKRAGVSDRLDAAGFIEELARIGSASKDKAAELRMAAAGLCSPGMPAKYIYEQIDKLEQFAERI